jgi:endonuclease III
MASKAVRERAREVVRILADEYPGTADELCALQHDGPFQLLVATILSAQCTDERVNMTTPAVFDAYPTPDALAEAPIEELENLIRPTGFFRSKAKNLIGMATGVRDRFGGEVPADMDALTTLPGVGRKTANVVLSVSFGLPGLPVDTHVGRLARRLKLTKQDDPVKVEADLDALVAPEDWGTLSVRLILHGRKVCTARVAHCERCSLAGICPSVGITAKALARGKRPSKPRQASIS